MTSSPTKMLTIVVEAAIERLVARDLERAGVSGFTMMEARGFGEHGHREGDWDQSRSVRIETICDAGTAASLADRLLQRWGEDYAMIVWLQDVEVLRRRKFGAANGSGSEEG